MTLLSALGAAIGELAADAGVTAITSRIRPIEPAPGDAKGPGSYLPFVVVTVLDAAPMGHMGIREVTLGVRCYAATYPAAEALWLACEEVFLDRGARRTTSGLGVYHSVIQAGGTPDRDPDTFQPLFSGIVRYPVTIHAVPAPMA
jgi:hypothetical protein